jgi:hypothetical protein
MGGAAEQLLGKGYQAARVEADYTPKLGMEKGRTGREALSTCLQRDSQIGIMCSTVMKIKAKVPRHF